MDLVFIIIGVIITIVGAGKKDDKGSRTGTGISLLTLGITLIVVGALWFSITFFTSFTNSYNKAISPSPAANVPSLNQSDSTTSITPTSNNDNWSDQTTDAYKQNFVNSCVKNVGEKYRSICECMLNKIESNYSYAQALEFDKYYRETNQLPPEMKAIAQSCVQ